MSQWNTLPTDEILEKTAKALTANNMTVHIVATGEMAKEKVLECIPLGAEVFTMTSRTLETIGIPQEINESGNYTSVRNELMKLDRKMQSLQMQKLGAAPAYAVGSVHAVTQDGKLLIASNTGSQLAAYVYGAEHVVWVIGAQKIVKNIGEGEKRIYEYVLPLESKRLGKILRNPNYKSFVSKLLIVNREIKQGRITIIFVKQVLGF